MIRTYQSKCEIITRTQRVIVHPSWPLTLRGYSEAKTHLPSGNSCTIPILLPRISALMHVVRKRIKSDNGNNPLQTRFNRRLLHEMSALCSAHMSGEDDHI